MRRSVRAPTNPAEAPASAVAAGAWRDSAALYSAFAPRWDQCFDAASHRNAYELLAWEYICRILPSVPGVVVDVGCGTGRWAAKFLALGHRVVGIEQAPEMVKAVQAKDLGAGMTLIAASMEEVALPPAGADLVVAMGSVQYARDPAAMIARFASWTRPGGCVFVCVDSLVAVVLELISLGRSEEALRILGSRKGIFELGGHRADLHLHDRRGLEAYFTAAGLVDLDCRGLLVTMSALGREACYRAIASDRAAFLELERELSASPVLADAGKHLVASGRRPA
jgi:SAM-dependent methyltransferase